MLGESVLILIRGNMSHIAHKDSVSGLPKDKEIPKYKTLVKKLKEPSFLETNVTRENIHPERQTKPAD